MDDRPFPPHFPVTGREFSTGGAVLCFVHAEEHGAASLVVPPGTTRVLFAHEQLADLVARLAGIVDAERAEL